MRRVDTFNFIDIIAIDTNCIVAIQACTGSGHAEHKRKIIANEYAKAWLGTGNKIELWSWSKRKVKRGGKQERWVGRVENITINNF